MRRTRIPGALIHQLDLDKEMDPMNIMADALCAHVDDPDVFFPPKGSSGAEAKQICAGCPIRKECLEWALDNHPQFGIWSGTSELERRVMRRGHAERQVNQWLAAQAG